MLHPRKIFLSVHNMDFFLIFFFNLMQDIEEKESSPLALGFITESTTVVLPLGGL